jgi:hypothetical protein
MKPVIRFVAVAAVFGVFLGGCAVDTLTVVEHPAQVKPGGALSVALGHGCLFLSDSSVSVKDLRRDSIHVLIGAPQGWNVEAVSYYVADHLNLVSELEAYIDSAALYATRASPMARSTAAEFSIADEEFEAHGRTFEETVVVSTSSVEQWFEYAAPVDLEVPEGAPMDTVFAVDSSFAALLPDTVTPAQLNMARAFGYDSIGVKGVPVFIFALLTAPSAERTDTLYYYTKSDTIPSSLKGNPMYGGYGDLGAMAFVPVEVSEAAPEAVVRGPGRVPGGGITVFPSPFRGRCTIGTGAARVRSIGIYSAGGELAASIDPPADGRFAVWNGTDGRGRAAVSGVYIVSVEYEGHAEWVRVRLIR